ncbi:MAG: bifunctional methylenetetrahydrofolate dehydrogenase/methenyltetrahydrofolate cyclohydrolase FolD [Candidatus Gastranaerophilales bacterium]|nr:bifunctional methylenetetrahydrofolate dehydrogenase/methenyltetrahydrofolate cyclohydrolase FolD [Candidatus Gastranaerophilales bacterium]
MANLIKGKELSEKIVAQVREEALKYEKEAGRKPGLTVIIVGENPASKVYVNKKKKTSEEAGFKSEVIALPEDVSQQELEWHIDKLNADSTVDGILVQLPLPKHINTYEILERIAPDKDVDGFHPINAGKLMTGLKPYAVPCTPYGIIRLLDENRIEIEGKHAVVIGRSNIVGKPVAALLLNRSATVTVCHSKTNNLPEICVQADILVAAVGIPKFVKADWVKEGATIIDVGINRTEEGKLVGDVDFDNVAPKAGNITPVPGGVGPMTIAMLLSNTLDLFKLHIQQ